MGDRKKYENCFDNLIEKFNTYDQYVDVVSCWEAFLEDSYSDLFPNFQFDRFPSIPIKGRGPFTPEFTVYFNDEYGIVFEVKRTFPRGEEAFEKELNQLKKYSNFDLSFKTPNSRKKPDKYDIVLLTGHIASMNTAKRIQDRLDSGEIQLDSNLVLIEYMYPREDVELGYQFRRIPILEQNFRDDCLSEKYSLSKKMKLKNPKNNIFVSLNDFIDYKARGVLCNDKPPPLYLACYLWHKVFYPEYLSKSQKKYWQRGNINKIFKIKPHLGKLKNLVNNKYIPGGGVSIGWLKKTFKFLKEAKLAVKENKRTYTVKYRNLRKRRNKYRKKGKSEFSDLARVLAEYYCQERVKENKEIEKKPKKDSKEKQRKLNT